jgi:hypothetical protein
MADIVELSSFVYECPENNRLRPLIATYWVCMIYFHHSYISEALKRLHLDLSVHIFNEQCSLLAQLKNEELFDDLYEHWEAREEAVSSDGHGWDQDDVIRRVVENAFELFNKGSRKFKGNIIFPSTEIQ